MEATTTAVDEAVPEFIGQRELLRRLAISQSSLYRMMKAGEFPRPVRVGLRRVAWPLEDVRAWIAARLEERD